MRDGFRAITGGWTLISGIDDLTERIERVADWMKVNGALEPDEQATIEMMINAQIARGMFPEFGLPNDDEDAADG